MRTIYKITTEAGQVLNYDAEDAYLRLNIRMENVLPNGKVRAPSIWNKKIINTYTVEVMN